MAVGLHGGLEETPKQRGLSLPKVMAVPPDDVIINQLHRRSPHDGIVELELGGSTAENLQDCDEFSVGFAAEAIPVQIERLQALWQRLHEGYKFC